MKNRKRVKQKVKITKCVLFPASTIVCDIIGFFVNEHDSVEMGHCSIDYLESNIIYVH